MTPRAAGLRGAGPRWVQALCWSAVCLLFLSGSLVQAQVINETQKLFAEPPPAPSPPGNETFGTAVAISGDTALIGAPGFGGTGNRFGRVYALSNSSGTWTQTQFLPRPVDSAGGDRFGEALAISGDGNTAVIGAYNKDGLRGAAWVYTRDALGVWSEEARLIPSGLVVQNQGFATFGVAVAISGDTVVVGAGWDDYTGAAYVFSRTSPGTWTQEARLVGDPGPGGTYFGQAVAIDGGTVVVGAYGTGGPCCNRGRAYVYTRDTGGTGAWGLEQRLNRPGAVDREYFGISVAVEGDVALIGAHGLDGPSGNWHGGMFTTTRTGTAWSPPADLVTSPGGQFGATVALSGGNAVIGNSGGDFAYVFDGSSRLTLERSDRAAAGITNFGGPVAISGSTMLVGSFRDDAAGPDAGAAYIFDLPNPDVDGDGVLNENDYCPATAAGFAVDGFGCAAYQRVGETGAAGLIGPQGLAGADGAQGEGLFPGSLLMLPAGSDAPAGYTLVGTFDLDPSRTPPGGGGQRSPRSPPRSPLRAAGTGGLRSTSTSGTSGSELVGRR